MKYLVHYATVGRGGFDWGWADSLQDLKEMIDAIIKRENNDVVFHGVYEIGRMTNIMLSSDGTINTDKLNG